MQEIHKVQELIYIQIKALQALRENKYPKRNRKIIKHAHQKLACFLLDIGVVPPMTINQWLLKHTNPLLDWLPDTYDELPINTASSLYDLQINDISDTAFWFLQYTGTPRDYQTKPILEVINHCTKYSKVYQKGYELFRQILTDPRNAVLSEKELNELLDSVDDPVIKDKLNECYEIVNNWSDYRVCENCGYTLHFNQTKWECGKYNVCGKISGTRFSNWNFINPPAFTFGKNEKVFRLTHGVHSSVLVPGIPEARMYSRLSSKYHVELYPNVDRDGDIRVRLENQVIDFDVKSYRHPDGLAYQIKNQIENEPKNLPIFVVPREYTASWKSGYINRVKSFFKDEDKVEILSESNLNRFLSRKVEGEYG